MRNCQLCRKLGACQPLFVLEFIDWLRTQPEQHVLIVAHEETLRVFEAQFKDNIADEHLRNIQIGNCEVSRYRIESELNRGK